MKIAECQYLLTATLSTTRIPAPQDTTTGQIAASVLEMACAYESDGIQFLASGDPVNALAGFYYGFGWLHFGLSSGLLIVKGTAACPFAGQPEILPPLCRAKLEEKSYRYAHLLETASSSVTCAPDPATRSHGFAGQILFIAMVYARQGNQLLKSGTHEKALACFSYGHGWLDAGVAAGLFRITSNRDIFCI
ncbi:MAG: DUF357 domain-containing protein [Methanoregula sp.]|jgi:hypothetical protein